MEKEFGSDSIRFLDHGVEKACIAEAEADGVITITLSGTLSQEIANPLLDEMTALIVAGQGLVVDLEKTEYVSASVMEALLRTEKLLEKSNKYLRIINMSQEVYEGFKARGLHELLDIEVKKA